MSALTLVSPFAGYRFRRILRKAASENRGLLRLFGSLRPVRIDGRVHATFVDADIEGSGCVSGRCFAAVDVNMVWQTGLTAGIVVRLR